MLMNETKGGKYDVEEEKRDISRYAGIGFGSGLRDCRMERDAAQRESSPADGRADFRTAGTVSAPVSYTHLDVYKRQGPDGLYDRGGN